MPGKLAMLATVPTDLTQIYCHFFRIAQKLAYLYGWDDLSDSDDETYHQLMLLLGAMFGLEIAITLVQTLTNGIARQLAKEVIR